MWRGRGHLSSYSPLSVPSLKSLHHHPSGAREAEGESGSSLLRTQAQTCRCLVLLLCPSNQPDIPFIYTYEIQECNCTAADSSRSNTSALAHPSQVPRALLVFLPAAQCVRAELGEGGAWSRHAWPITLRQSLPDELSSPISTSANN